MAQAGPVHVNEDKESQGRVSCILAAHLLLSTCFLPIWFSLVVFRVPSGTNSALCFQVSKMLRSAPRKTAYSGLFKNCLQPFPWVDWALKEPVLFLFFFFSKFSRRDVCNVSLGFVFDLISSFEMLRCNMVHFWGKCKIVFPFYLCDSLTCFWNMCSKWFFILYYCFGHVALMTSVYQILSSLKCGDEELWNYSKIFVPWAQYCIINIFNGMNFIPSAYVCKY